MEILKQNSIIENTSILYEIYACGYNNDSGFGCGSDGDDSSGGCGCDD